MIFINLEWQKSLDEKLTKKGKKEICIKKHLLVVVAERVRDAQFGNIHQSSLSIPDVAI